jgi:hypothetical protein
VGHWTGDGRSNAKGPSGGTFPGRRKIVTVARGVRGAGYSLETQNRPVFEEAPDAGLMVHELAHQWFGDSLTAKDWGDIWLHEGFATYAESLWAAAHGGPSTAAQFSATMADNPASSTLWSPARRH